MATITDEELKAVKQFMKLDGVDDDDDVVKALYAAAKIYLKNGGVTLPDEDPELYNLALWSLTLHYYDHRDAVGNEAAIPIGLRPIINQLKQDAEILRSVST